MPTRRVDLTANTWTPVATGACRVSTTEKIKLLGLIADTAPPAGNANFESFNEFANYTLDETVYINPFKSGVSHVIVTGKVVHNV